MKEERATPPPAPDTCLLVLVGCDCHELGLGEDVGPEGAAGQLEQVVGLDDVQSGLVPVHGVQDALQVGGGQTSRGSFTHFLPHLSQTE